MNNLLDITVHRGATSRPFGVGGWIGVRQVFQQTHRAESVTVTKPLAVAFAENEFRAAAADVHNQQRLTGEKRVRRDAAKRPVRLLLAGNDFDRQSRNVLDGGGQFRGIDRIPRGARCDDA